MTPRISVPAMDRLRKLRAIVERDDANLVIPFVFDSHVAGSLNDLEVAVVGAGQNWRSPERNAALAEVQIFGDIGLYRSLGIGVVLVGAALACRLPHFGGFGRQGGNLAVGRIH